ncbi:MAG: hypothetical protein IIY09_00720 [Clostridia bacterium]|nr:hypothetical protein [Clostridia bacterium]
MWLANFLPFSDPDGEWTNSTVSIFSWDKQSGGQGSVTGGLEVEHDDKRQMFLQGVDETGTGKVYTVTEGMFNSFIYTQNVLAQDGKLWYEIDGSKIGVYSDWYKAPMEGQNTVASTVFLNTQTGAKAYATTDGTTYYLWLQNAVNYPWASSGCQTPRALLVWYNAVGGVNMQTFFIAYEEKGKTPLSPALPPESGAVTPPEGDDPEQGELPEVTQTYKNGWTDEELVAAYAVTEDNVISYLTADYRTTGNIFAISKNVYDELPRQKYTLAGGWEYIDGSQVFFNLGGTLYPFKTWENTVFHQQHYVKKVGDCYFMWLANFLPFSDPDGGWTSSAVTGIVWNKPDGTQGSSNFNCHVEAAAVAQVTFVGVDSFNGTGRVYEITKSIYDNFIYSGESKEISGITLRALDLSKVGLCTSWYKAPMEGEVLTEQIKWFNGMTLAGGGVYTYEYGGKYYLWYDNYAAFTVVSSGCQSARAIIVWYNAKGELCMQSYLV